MIKREKELLALALYFAKKYNDSNPEVGMNDYVLKFVGIVDLLKVEATDAEIEESAALVKEWIEGNKWLA